MFLQRSFNQGDQPGGMVSPSEGVERAESSPAIPSGSHKLMYVS